ncbi:hypothetical protein [Paraburkholderia sp. EG304]
MKYAPAILIVVASVSIIGYAVFSGLNTVSERINAALTVQVSK